jgi:hypothetical protein
MRYFSSPDPLTDPQSSSIPLPPHANSFIIGTAVINTHNIPCSNKTTTNTHIPFPRVLVRGVQTGAPDLGSESSYMSSTIFLLSCAQLSILAQCSNKQQPTGNGLPKDLIKIHFRSRRRINRMSEW